MIKRCLIIVGFFYGLAGEACSMVIDWNNGLFNGKEMNIKLRTRNFE